MKHTIIYIQVACILEEKFSVLCVVSGTEANVLTVMMMKMLLTLVMVDIEIVTICV